VAAYIGESSVEVKTEAEDVIESSHNNQPTTGMFGFTHVLYSMHTFNSTSCVLYIFYDTWR